MGLTCSPCSAYWLASHHSKDGHPSVICTVLAETASGSPASWPGVLGGDFYPLVKYCPHLCWLLLQNPGWWSGGRPDFGSGTQATVLKGATSFPFSMPLRKNFSSAFQQDDLTQNLAQHFFFPFSTTVSCH